MSENTKTHDEISVPRGDEPGSEPDQPARPSPIDDVEAQMRRALSALGPGGMLRPRPDHDRGDSGGNTMRLQDRFSPAHRRKFVQDGDVPVAYVRREQQRDTGAAQVSAPSALTIRLQRAEAELASQTAARHQAERTAAEAQAALRDLRTKLGHVELARTEAVEALRREKEDRAARLAVELEDAARRQEHEDRLHALQRGLHTAQAELTVERTQRKTLEKELRAAQAAKETAERLVRVLSDRDESPQLAARRPAKPVERPETDDREPEPVKWWLNAPTTKRR